MLNRILIILLAVSITACGTPKKALQSLHETLSSTIEKTEFESINISKQIDTTRVEKGKVTITEIEFFPPSATDEPQTSVADSIQNTLLALSKSHVIVDNVGKIFNAAVKSIKQTTIEQEIEEKGESSESTSNEVVREENIEINNEIKSKSETKPAPDPYRWRYIFYIMLLILAVFLYFKRTPILNKIKAIFSKI